jgi:hypothetical protein
MLAANSPADISENARRTTLAVVTWPATTKVTGADTDSTMMRRLRAPTS